MYHSKKMKAEAFDSPYLFNLSLWNQLLLKHTHTKLKQYHLLIGRLRRVVINLAEA